MDQVHQENPPTHQPPMKRGVCWHAGDQVRIIKETSRYYGQNAVIVDPDHANKKRTGITMVKFKVDETGSVGTILDKHLEKCMCDR